MGLLLVRLFYSSSTNVSIEVAAGCCLSAGQAVVRGRHHGDLIEHLRDV